MRIRASKARYAGRIYVSVEPIKNEYAKDTSSRSRQCIRERSSTGRSSGRGATRSIGAADVRTDRPVLDPVFRVP